MNIEYRTWILDFRFIFELRYLILQKSKIANQYS